MLTVTHVNGPLGLSGLSGPYGPIELHKVLGVPFKWQLVSPGIGGQFYVVKETSDRSVDVPKKKVPRALAKAIDQVLAKAIAAVLKAKPDLATNPTELLAQAKKHPIYSRTFMGLTKFDGAIIGKVGKINDKNTLPYVIYMQDLGTSYRLKLYAPKSSVLPPGFDKLIEVVTYPAKLATEIALETVDALKEGLEAVFKLLAEILKGLCKIADSDIAKLAQSIGAKYSGSQSLTTDLATSFSTGDKAKLTKTVTDIYAGGSTVKIAAANVVLTQLQGMCGSKDKALTPPPPPKKEKKKKPWYKRPGVYLAGGGIAAGLGTLIYFTTRKRR
jgi:hypothetical protein